jgi:hypothetical protein
MAEKKAKTKKSEGDKGAKGKKKSILEAYKTCIVRFRDELDKPARDNWDRFAKSVTVRDLKGNRACRSGLSLYVAVNVERVLSGKAIADAPILM